MRVLYALAKDQPGGAVLDSNFRRSIAIGEIRGLPGPVVEVHCRCDREAALSRYRSRAATRHPGHFDETRHDDDLWNADVTEPLAGGWAVVEVDTNRDVDVPMVMAALRRACHIESNPFP